jgi:hypothetical protein
MHPSDALPLAPRPDLDQYRKLAKDLLKASRSGDPAAVQAWVARFLENLASLCGESAPPRLDAEAPRIAQFVRSRLDTPTLAGAQFAVARLHGFESWPRFSRHVLGTGGIRRFESAVDAVVAGDTAALESLLREDPALARARSTRSHRATLLHYTSANGVENFRQLSPKNAPRVAEILLAAGAEVDAVLADGESTTLGLVATSKPPARAGVQEPLMELLFSAGAAVDGAPGGWQPLMAALANARPEAAALLARRGAQMTVVAAAGLGRLDLVRGYFDPDGSPRADTPYVPVWGVPKPPKARLERAFIYACTYGHTEIAAFLLEKGVDRGARDDAGQTGLHLAAHGGHVETVRFLIARGAPLEVTNVYGGTVLGQALWSAANDSGGWGGNNPDADYTTIVEDLIAAGARVDPEWSTGKERIDALLARAKR